MVIKAHVKRNTYFDSITLMKIARGLTGMDGIEDAAAIMATEPNLQLLAQAGLTPFEGGAGPADVLLVVRARDDSSAETALQAAEQQLAHRPTSYSDASPGGQKQPRSLEQAIQLRPDARLAVISVPGPYAALESERALRAGLHVFLFSDNVPLADEIALKRLAQERNLLLMGPDCGTAMLNGAGLGFVNVVPRGPIGIVGASGTGIQQVMSLIAQQGSGVSQVIGCGGRDLSEAVGAITTLQGLHLLQEDEQTEVIVLISKPPAAKVAERVLEVATTGKKPVIVIFVGADHDALQSRYRHRVVITRTLAEAARKAVSIGGGSETTTGTWFTGTPSDKGHSRIPIGKNVVASLVDARSTPAPSLVDTKSTPMDARSTPADAKSTPAETLPGGQAGEPGGLSHSRFLSALFSGGTLCDEAMHIWAEGFPQRAPLRPIYSNIPLKPEWRLPEGQEGQVRGHCAIDFGADEYTRGRPHPMIDPSLRLKRLQEAARNPYVRVILLDIVLGYCSHPDPASVYAPAILAARRQASQAGRSLTLVISLCGTEGDPQRLSIQAARFREAGAEVFTSNADAALRCIEILA
jgi:FdrA protein